MMKDSRQNISFRRLNKLINTDQSFEEELNMFHSLCVFRETFEIILICVGLPIICVSGYVLFRLLKANKLTPDIFVINLLILDLIQVVVRAVYYITITITNLATENSNQTVLLFFFYLCSCTRIFLLTCVSLERYVMIAHPLWYQRHRSIKTSILVSTASWVLPYSLIFFCLFESVLLVLTIFIHLIYILIQVFSIVGAWRGLSAAISFSDQEKLKIMGTLILALVTYTILFLPFNCMLLINRFTPSDIDNFLVLIVLDATMIWSCLSCLVDPFLYIFMRNYAMDSQVVFPCCSKLLIRLTDWKRDTGSRQTDTTTSETTTAITTVSETVIAMSTVNTV